MFAYSFLLIVLPHIAVRDDVVEGGHPLVAIDL